MRILCEITKLTLLIMVLAFDKMLWEDIIHEDGHMDKTQYWMFISFAGMSALFSFITFIWSQKRVRKMQLTKLRNQSAQVKAMWRMDEQHFNTNVGVG